MKAKVLFVDINQSIYTSSKNPLSPRIWELLQALAVVRIGHLLI